MGNYTISFTQTATANVDVQARDLEEAQRLAAKHICRQGDWVLDRDRYVVDGRVVESISA